MLMDAGFFQIFHSSVMKLIPQFGQRFISSEMVSLQAGQMSVTAMIVGVRSISISNNSLWIVCLIDNRYMDDVHKYNNVKTDKKVLLILYIVFEDT